MCEEGEDAQLGDAQLEHTRLCEEGEDAHLEDAWLEEVQWEDAQLEDAQLEDMYYRGKQHNMRAIQAKRQCKSRKFIIVTIVDKFNW